MILFINWQQALRGTQEAAMERYFIFVVVGQTSFLFHAMPKIGMPTITTVLLDNID